MKILLHLHSFLQSRQSPHIRVVNVVFLSETAFHIPCKLEALFQQLAGICYVLILLSEFYRFLREMYYSIGMDPKYNENICLKFLSNFKF